MNLHEELAWRGLIFQESDSAGIRALLKGGTQTVYAGFDPTADSLHVGSLMPLLGLRRFQLAGHRPIVLLGGGTGLIGDPSGKNAERGLQSEETVQNWVSRFREQMEGLIDMSPGPCSAILVDNYQWIGKMSAIEYLRDLGKHFPVSWMLAKDSVQNRLDRAHGGISYTEFSYMLLQSLDFLHLAQEYDCKLQIGGSDQWGNMTAGIELIRRKLSKPAFVMTLPLILAADGKKFGKSEGNAVWLDPEKTSPYAFYQYWLNTDDRDVIRFVKFLTFVPAVEIAALEQELGERPEQRAAHRRLAEEMTRMVHGQTELDKVIKASAALFGKGELRDTDLPTLKAAVASAPSIGFDSVEKVPVLPQLLMDVGLNSSKSEARKTIRAGGVYLNNARVKQEDFQPSSSDFLHGKLLILRRGKKSYAIVRVGD